MIQKDPVTMIDDLCSRKWHVWFGISVRPIHVNVKSDNTYIFMCWLYTLVYVCIDLVISDYDVMQCFESVDW
jgi:hypothetical protein